MMIFMMSLTLDSSVIAKLFLEELGSSEAMKIMELSYFNDINLIASELIFYEVGNTIWKNLRKGNKVGTKYIDKLFSLNIDYIYLNKELARSAMKLAHYDNVTFYDSVHIVISQKYESPLVTEDKLLLKKFNITVDIKEALELINESTKY